MFVLRRPCHPRVSWKKPLVGWLKGNFDGGFDVTLKRGAIGIIIRDSSGRVVGGKAMVVEHVTSPELIEALAGR